ADDRNGGQHASAPPRSVGRAGPPRVAAPDTPHGRPGPLLAGSADRAAGGDASPRPGPLTQPAPPGYVQLPRLGGPRRGVRRAHRGGSRTPQRQREDRSRDRGPAPSRAADWQDAP